VSFRGVSEAVCASVFKCSVKKSGDFPCDRPGKVVWHSRSGYFGGCSVRKRCRGAATDDCLS
jgi:hypothetical protein